MKQKIKILDEHTSNQIAAGEVIERPASVIKELLENSIDAQSTRIEVKLQQGGLTRIQVLDNGRGMIQEDCVLAFSRHATSKIANADDLLKIRTLGFRGEALPSIAAVSKIQLTSKPTGALEGTSIQVEGGKIVDMAAAGCPEGTEIIVEDLFFNTPARKKYLKKPTTEAAHAINVVQRLAMGHPELSFQLWHNDQQVFATSGLGRLKDILIDLYGLEYAQNMIPISNCTPTIELKGLVGKGYQHRSSRDQQTFIVNGRHVRSSLLQVVLEEAYRGLLPNRRYPVAVVYLNISPEFIDVNVHPAKLEVKFANPEEVSQALGVALAKALKETQHIPSLISSKEHPASMRRTERVREAVESYLQTQWTSAILPKTAGESLWKQAQPQQITLPKEELGSTGHNHILPSRKVLIATEAEANTQFPILKAIGQLHESFILAQGTDGLYVIDQHGAHERINYEYLQEKVRDKAAEAQALAIPTTLELNPVESELLISRIIELTDLGIIIEHFGKNTFLIRTVPPGLDGEETSELVLDLLHVWHEGSSHGFETVEHGIKMLACKQAVKANNRLSLEEQQALLENLGQLCQPFTCPHGRPIIISFDMKELRRRFGRN